MSERYPDRGWAPVPGLPAPKGAYSPAIEAGGFVFVSGQVPRDPETGEVVGADVAAQTRQAFANVSRVLAAAGLDLADVVQVTAWLARIEDWDAFDAVYREHFTPPYPTRTTVGAGLRGVLVELTVVARARAHGR